MKKILQRIPLFILPFVLVISGCGGSDKKNDADKNAKSGPQEQAPTVALKPVDLSTYGIPLTVQAPDGAVVTKEEGTVVVVKKDRFNIVVSEDKYGEEGAIAEAAKDAALAEDTKMLNDPDMGMKMEVLKNEPRGYLYMTTNRAGGKIVRFTCVVNKEGRNYFVKENFMDLNDMEKSMETGYSISREEAEAMYNAVKQ